ncbi:hypothetical protein [Tardiphaga sp. 813_E8_N1_3]|uniref:hypothetical protein n=1 Tax=Tardiphaga sp. 813_E8_N1_3 TaxID=3240760 RepID=UPI003F212D28
MKKDPIDIPPDELARLRVSFGLRRMSREVQNDVLSEGSLATDLNIELSSPIRLPDGITIERQVLFSAFQKTADGEVITELPDAEGISHEVKIEIEADSAVVTYAKHRVNFVQAALLTKNVDRRRALCADILKNKTLNIQARAEFEALAEKRDFSEDDFFAAGDLLAGAPENFIDDLREAATTGSLSIDNFVPPKTAHWENVSAKHQSSQTIAQFISDELAAERRARIADDPRVAIDTISLTFGAPELVPLEMFREIDASILLDSLKRLTDVPDPFALCGALDICIDRASADQRFLEVGEIILDRLAGDPKRLLGELNTFATAFVIATAHLAQHEVMRRLPVFWRRLAAFSHACLVTRALGANDTEDHPLLSWATRLSGKQFYLSVLNEAHVEPRWRPDWVSPGYLAADIYGRVSASLQKLSDDIAPAWLQKLENAKPLLIKDVPPLAYAFPAIPQGGWVPPPEMPSSETPVAEMFAEFAADPSVSNFLMYIQFAYVYGFPVDARESVLKVIQSLRSQIATTEPEHVQAALELAAFIAARNRDAEIAEAVATVAIERLVGTQNIDRILPTVTVILQCAAAEVDRKEAIAALAQRLENLSFVAPADALPEVLDILRILQSLNEELAPLLGRAIATARLGIPRVAAVTN